ncbi:endocuticle structural glycoprotein SgAbd-5-like [Uranotaenia lowii]|uniref:endocuticle structural glycoprotein SgAbd-5-like n=1 Tax=Uranotaenia lowii TaxID=190385 RepID=UPI002478BFEA|nr:endocuticle structural glycoprotein SgAbd-5-like [Uranotaenia lowii]
MGQVNLSNIMFAKWFGNLLLLIMLLILGSVTCKPVSNDGPPITTSSGQNSNKDSSQITIVRYENTRTEKGYKFVYETSDGQVREEEGTLVKGADGKEYMTVEGHYSYIGTDGEQYEQHYVADQDGYRPTEPPIGISNNVLLSLVG